MKSFTDYTKTYNYCGICGHVPKGRWDEANRATIRWWDVDDGWKVGSLCEYCFDETRGQKPKPGDYAFDTTNGIADDVNTDLDILDTLEGI